MSMASDDNGSVLHSSETPKSSQQDVVLPGYETVQATSDAADKKDNTPAKGQNKERNECEGDRLNDQAVPPTIIYTKAT